MLRSRQAKGDKLPFAEINKIKVKIGNSMERDTYDVVFITY